jgi:hypothetical protein
LTKGQQSICVSREREVQEEKEQNELLKKQQQEDKKIQEQKEKKDKLRSANIKELMEVRGWASITSKEFNE